MLELSKALNTKAGLLKMGSGVAHDLLALIKRLVTFHKALQRLPH